MSEHTKETVASDTATFLLMDALRETSGCVPPHIDKLPAAAIMASAHALVAKLDSMETSLLSALGDLRESLDYLAAGNDAELVPCKHESEVIYRALEEDYLLSHQAATIDEMDAALRRFKRLAGIEE